MSLLFPRVAFAPARCAPVAFRSEVAPLWGLFDETFTQLERASRTARKQFNPRFDVKEAKDSYVVEGELPGFDPKNLSIEFLDDGHTLQIKGRTQHHTESGPKPQAVESQEQPKAVEGVTSETASVKSHQPTVEDEEEHPANSSVDAATAEASSSQEVAAPVPEQTQAVEQTQPKEPEVKRWISERHSGGFSRSFKFPSRVNQEAVKASLKDGILSITLPFAEKSASRTINIE